jgi:cytochrome P450
MTDKPTPVTAEKLGDDYYQDPLGHYERMRGAAPVVPAILPDGQRVWMITRYEDVRAALTDPRLVKDLRKLAAPDWKPDPVAAFLYSHLLNSDPPTHTRLRHLVQKAFTAGHLAAWRPRIEEIAGSLLDTMSARVAAGEPELDLIEQFAFPFPMTVMCELLGLPNQDRDQFKAWSQTLISPLVTRAEFRSVGAAMTLYFTRLIAAKRQEPSGDLLSALIGARDDTDALTEHELLAMIFLLIVAGHETTANLIASGTLALLQHPAELVRLRASPSLLPQAIEELLRYTNPFNRTTDRYTLNPVEIAGVTIPAGEAVLCVTSSANHDPSRFQGADQLDLGRDSSGHLAFGHGIHYCVGASLARLEGEVAFAALLARFPALALAATSSELRWRPNSVIHGLEALPVRLALPARSASRPPVAAECRK